jgi:hypothetical protein
MRVRHQTAPIPLVSARYSDGIRSLPLVLCPAAHKLTIAACPAQDATLLPPGNTRQKRRVDINVLLLEPRVIRQRAFMDDPERPLALPAISQAERPAARSAWLTYAQAGERLGMSAEAVRHRARRSCWRTMPGNDGRTLVMVPAEIEVQPVRTPARAVDRAPNHAADQSAETARAHARADRAEADRHAAEERADQAHKRADVAIALADRTLAQLFEANTERAAAVARANQAERELTAERRRADQAEITVDRLEAELEAERIVRGEAEAHAAELHQTDATRRGQGRWARLRAAWRGE